MALASSDTPKFSVNPKERAITRRISLRGRSLHGRESNFRESGTFEVAGLLNRGMAKGRKV